MTEEYTPSYIPARAAGQDSKRLKEHKNNRRPQVDRSNRLKSALADKETIINSITELVVLQGLDQEIVWSNKAALESVGAEEEDLIGRYCYEIWGQGEAPCENCSVAKALATGRDHENETRKPDGSYWLIKGYPVKNEEGAVIGAIEIAMDITERKLADEILQEYLKEKETLIREIHHRVKNNLAVINSLLRLQSRRSNDSAGRRMFKDMEDRVRSMALAHEMLYQSESLVEVEMDQYVSRLTEHLFASVGALGRRISFKKEIGDVRLRLDRAVPLGCILTELISNALKHAFPENSLGSVVVSLREIRENELELIVKDDGIGFAKKVDLSDPDTFGLGLVNILAKQLGGCARLMEDNGATITLRFQRG